jgi:hypothetical protein
MIILDEGQVVAMMGRERFDRLRSRGWLSPQARSQDGEPMWTKSYVELRLDEDVRLSLCTSGGSVTKSLGNPDAGMQNHLPLPLPSTNQAGGRRVPTNQGTRSTTAPGTQVCQQCGGNGNCPLCEGVGIVTGMNCQACRGSGDCSMCGGTGMARKGKPVLGALEQRLGTLKSSFEKAARLASELRRRRLGLR